MRRAGVTLLTGAAALLLAGCSSATTSATPNWEASPTGPAIEGSPGVHVQPIIPVPSLSGAPNGSPGAGGPGGSGGPSGSGGASPNPSATDPAVVAKNLKSPVGLTLLPDGSALVGERTTGRIVRVQPKPDQPVPTVRTLPGLDTSGDGGLLDLAISPTYDEDNLVYAYITTATDNRVVDFTLNGPVTPVLTGIPKGRTGNTGRLAFSADGNLYVGTGDGGTSSRASDPKSLAGKVLRIDVIGQPAHGNPTPSSPIYTSGHRVVDGLCAVPGTKSVLEVETGGPRRPDKVNVLVSGAYYGWPTTTRTQRLPATVVPSSFGAPGGCTVLDNRIWISSLDGTALVSAPVTGGSAAPGVGNFTPILQNKYGRLKTVVAASDGALWLTTSNRDGHGKPIAADERVIRYVPSQSDGGGNKVA
jgi:glucose/arabinose dehydrogenase